MSDKDQTKYLSTYVKKYNFGVIITILLTIIKLRLRVEKNTKKKLFTTLKERKH